MSHEKVSACLRSAAEQDDCPETLAGATDPCGPASRTDTFRVEGKPVVLHLGRNAPEALSCMVHADGLLMGCSTFGQLAGVLNGGGISFFSTECGGHGAPLQSKMIPPLTVAERGRMWVPIAGSWRDPVLRAKHIFSAALDELLKRKQGSARGESRA